MASKKQFPNGKWQFRFMRKGVLEKPLYLTFDSEAEGDEYAARLEALLDRGIVPSEHQKPDRVMTISGLIREYERDAHPSEKDRGALSVTLRQHGDTPLSAINVDWVDVWISTMKRVEKLAPATIRARVGALARCTDWGVRKKLLTLPDTPLRNLPDGYAQYTRSDEAAAGVKRVDVERDRRLEPGEWERILGVIESGVLPRKQRPRRLPDKAAIRLLAQLGLETAMRLSEIYTLRIPQVDIPRRTIFLEKTKNGDKRQVPMTSVALKEFDAYLNIRQEVSRDTPESLGFVEDWHKTDMLLPWWDGTVKHRVATSDYLSRLFVNIFEQAGCKDLTFHSLRHEATSRLFERTTLSETQIMKITGHRSHRMVMRYANMRGSDLSRSLW